MNFCPKCGKPVEKGAKFCIHCGYQLDSHGANKNDFKSNFTDKFQELKSKINTSWFKDPKHKKYAGIAVIVLLVLFGLGHMIHNGGSLTAPKTISFAKQSKSSGRHVWIEADGKKKSSSLYDIFVLKNGKLKVYQIFDSNVTLGKVSSMNDNQLVSLGKKQDKKYFKESANEVRSLQHGQEQVGNQDDLMGDIDLKGELEQGPQFYLYGRSKGLNGHQGLLVKYTKLVSKDEYDKNFEKTSNTEESGNNQQHYQQETENGLVTGEKASKQLEQARYDALVQHIKKTKYLAPKWQKSSIDSSKDSNNRIDKQTINYKNIDEFNEDHNVMSKNVMKLSGEQQQKILDLANLKGQPTSIIGDESSENEDKQKQENAANAAFGKDFQAIVTDSVFKPHEIKDWMTLIDTTSVEVNNTRYIGYVIDNGDNYNTYLFTKAQNKSQKAVLSDH